MNKHHLILGGARSGKSSFAEQQIEILNQKSHSRKIYLATATANDCEMAERIEHHQRQRDNTWITIGEPLNLASQLDNCLTNDCVLIDCLTLWLSNCLHQNCWSEQREKFFISLKQCPANIVLVSNEVGYGIVPIGRLSRQFVDESGRLHQDLAAACSSVTLVTAGLPMTLK